MGAPARFTKADLKRAYEGLKEAGMRVGSVRIMPTGEIVVLSEGEVTQVRGNSCDDILK